MPSPELQMIIDFARATGGLSSEMPVEEQRAQYRLAVSAYPLASDVMVEKVDACGVPSEWVWFPGADVTKAVLYLHGGGYVIGGLDTHRELASRLARACRSRVLLVDYRLAPEHPFPAALEDATAAYRWLLHQGINSSSIVVAGDSAGGGLVVSTLVALRDSGAPLPTGAVCLSPWADLTNSGASQVTRAPDDPIVSKASLDKMASLYLDGADPKDPLASPLFADLSELPPLLVQVGTAEVLYDDAERLCDAARGYGVEATLHPFDGCIHVWQQLAATSPEAEAAVAEIGEFFREQTA